MPILASEIVIPISAVGVAAAAIYRAGQLGGKVETHDKRLDKLEDAQATAVSRAELDARFATLDAKIDTVIRLLEKSSE